MARLIDVAKAAGVFADMKERFPRTTFTQQGALLAAIPHPPV